MALAVWPSIVYAENCTAEEYMAEGIRAAYDNMHLIYQAYYDDEGNLQKQEAGHVVIRKEWDDEGRLLMRIYLDENCQPMKRDTGYSTVVWSQDNSVWNVSFYDPEERIVSPEGLNLVRDVKISTDGWSQWYTPTYETENSIIPLAIIVLPTNQVMNFTHARLQ